MSIRGIIFLLALYFAFAWVTVVLVYQSEDPAVILQKGLLWTAVGLGTVLLWLLAAQLVGWWRLRRARSQAAPAEQPAPPPAKRVHEHDAAFLSLLAEADSKLSRAPGGTGRRVRDYPIYLVLGADGAGKTSLLHEAGIDATLLAGQTAGSGAIRVANIWLANDSIFVEVGSQVLQGDAERFGEFLHRLRSGESAPPWRDFWKESAPTLELRGVILCRDLGDFVAAHDRAGIERSSNAIREKLLAISEVFGSAYPVYAMFTGANAIPFFDEFFGRLPEAEAAQPFGVLAEPASGKADESADSAWADRETRRVSRDFNSVFACLSARRLIALSHEPLAERKAAIYEFPREFKRLRAPVVQFLVDSLRPDPLRVSPALRGFFFCGTRQVEVSADQRGDTARQDAGGTRGPTDATQIFRPDATRVFPPRTEVPERAGMRVEKSAFLKDFFQVVLRNDRPTALPQAKSDPRRLRQRVVAVYAAAAIGSLATVAWAVSWVGNRALVRDVEANVTASGRGIRDVSLESLRALDNLRSVLVDRLDQPRPLHLNWGLYTGDRLREELRGAYFARLQQVLLNDANSRLVNDLRRLDPATLSAPYDAAYRRLKTHVTISTAACSVEPSVVAPTLHQATLELHPGLSEQQKELARRQIDYYVAALESGSPPRLRPDSQAVANARAYLLNARGPEQIYGAIVASVRKEAVAVLVRERVGDFRQAMSAPEEVSFEFTRAGRDKFERLADSGQFSLAGETCVLGASNQVQGQVANIEQIRRAKTIYYNRYKEAWEAFLGRTSVRDYRDAPDAVAKLDVLSGSASPLLGLVKFVGENTHFPAPKPATDGLVDRALTSKLPRLANAKKTAAKAAAEIERATAPEFGPADLTRIFQPVHLAVHPDARNLVTEANRPYVEGLRRLQEGLDKFRNASTTDRLPLIPQVQEAFTQATNAQRGLADSFHQDTGGIDQRLSEILLQPIRNARRLVPANPERAAAGERNEKLRQMCMAVGPVLQRYPFNKAAGAGDLTLADLTRAFAPGTGLIWKYQAQAMGDLVVKTEGRWEQKPDAPKPQVTAELLEFFNRAQAVSDAFFPGGVQHPRLQYSLRPIAEQTVKVRLQIDGRTMNSKESALRKDFEWPVAPGMDGADAYALLEGTEYGFGKYPGPWGVFRLFQYADERNIGEKIVTWSRTSGINAQPQPMTPVKVQFVEFPGGVDVFNPRFFGSMRCPAQAVAPQ